ncbi:MAG: radical SAM protein [bacterium]|nr:radical SAM protein [bacterium]
MKELNISVLRRKINKTLVPVNCSLELTSGCNLDCIHCLRDLRFKNELTTAELFDILNQLKDIGTIELALTGGEVFLRPDIFLILDKVFELGFLTTLFSNGVLIDDEKANRLKNYKFKSIDISLYGITPETHEKITAVPGSFSKTMGAILNLKRLGLNVHVKTMVLQENFSEFPQIKEFAEKNNFLFSFDHVIFGADSGSETPLGHLLNEDQVRTIENIRFEMGGRNTFQDDIDRGKNVHDIMCTMGRNVMAITPVGDVLPCITLRYPVGNLREQALKDIWINSEKLKWIRGLKDENFTECFNCSMKRLCRVCPGLNYTFNNNFFTPAKQKCRLTKIKCEMEVIK